MLDHLPSLACALGLAAAASFAPIAAAQAPGGPAQSTSPAQAPPAATGAAALQSADQRITELSREVEDLKALVLELREQVSRIAPTTPPAAANRAGATASATPATAAAAGATASATPATAAAAGASAGAPRVAADLLRGMTINAMLDGYYEYNFNAPIGRVNYLRAYDVSSNSFSLNQADLLVETRTRPGERQACGDAGIDLQYGQATTTLQGNPANELRPDMYRNSLPGLWHLCHSTGRRISRSISASGPARSA